MKFLILFASILIQSCIGGVYAWSEFVSPLKALGLTTAQTQLIFGVMIAVFTCAMIPAGRLLKRIGPIWIAGFGGLMFGSGYWLASCSGGNFQFILLGIGIIAGIGTGFCYVCPLAMCAQWFPNHKGLVTGIAVAGFGGGAVILSVFSELLLKQGYGILDIFKIIALSYGGIIMLASLPLRLPKTSQVTPLTQQAEAIWRDRYFWGLFIAMFAGTFSGLLVIGNLKPLLLSQGINPTVATAAVSVFALGNAFGRITWGWLADRLQGRTIPLSLAFLICSMLLTTFALNSSVAAICLSGLIGIGFGACFIVYATQTSLHYGVEQLGSIYPLIFLGYGLSALVGPWSGALIYDSVGSYSGGLFFAVILIIIGAICSLWLMRSVTQPCRVATLSTNTNT